MISVEHVTKVFRTRVAVDDVSFSVKEGEIVGFLGPNGAGKTTTMRIITGYMPATSGRVTVNGIDVFNNPLEVKKQIGYLPELPPVYTDMTTRSYLKFVAEIKGIEKKRIKDEIERVAQLCGINQVMDRIIGNLSKGFKQRVGLAQAIMGDPKVLILDEPTVGLDPKQIMEVREVIKELASDKTVILSTHILQEVSVLCERVIIINEGRIVADENISASGDGGNPPLLVIKVRNWNDQLNYRISSFEGVTKVEPAGEDHEFLIETDGRSDLRPKIARAVIEAGAELLELRSMTSNIENIFLNAITKR